jgi:ADP-ribose pyrophosphatase
MTMPIKDRQTIFKGRLIHLQNVDVELPNGQTSRYEVIRHPGAVAMLPVDEQGNIWFVQQYRVAVEQLMLEIPAGTLEAGEDPQDCAARELREEIGMSPAHLQKLATITLAPGYSSELLHLFLATGLSHAPLAHDDDEYLTPQLIAVKEAYAMAQRGEIGDSKTLSALLLAQPYLQRYA